MNRLHEPIAGRRMTPPDHPEPTGERGQRIDTVGTLLLAQRVNEACLELLEVAREQLGADEIRNKSGTLIYDKGRLRLDSFSTDMRPVPSLIRGGSGYTLKGLGS